jgi:N-acetyl-gamma-glutamyl-phosphate reductase
MLRSLRVGIVGASGYSGLELTQILAAHPHAHLQFASSDKFAGQHVSSRVACRLQDDPIFISNDAVARAAETCDVVFLATPAGVSRTLLPTLARDGLTIIDLSGAFRFRDTAQFEFTYETPALPLPPQCPQPVYSVPELHRKQIVGARHIANPGCYPTAALLAIAPFLQSSLCRPDQIIVNAASGVTGAGRQANEAYSHAEIEGDYRAYKILRHQHSPEIANTLHDLIGIPVALSFVPHLLPIRRGILATCYLWPSQKVTAQLLNEQLREYYAGEPFVDIVTNGDAVSLRRVVGTNRACIGINYDATTPTGPVVVVCAIDNLTKGASGQAVQNMNIALGFKETLALANLRGFSP